MQLALEKAATGLRPSNKFVVIDVDVSFRSDQPESPVSKTVEIYQFALIRMEDLKEFHFSARYSEIRQWFKELKTIGAITESNVAVPFPPKLMFPHGFRSIIGARSTSSHNPLLTQEQSRSSPPLIQSSSTATDDSDIAELLAEDSIFSASFTSSVFSSDDDDFFSSTHNNNNNNNKEPSETVIVIPTLPPLIEGRKNDLRNWLQALMYAYPNLLKNETAYKFLVEKKCLSPMERENLGSVKELAMNKKKTELFKTKVKQAITKYNEDNNVRNRQGLIGTEDLKEDEILRKKVNAALTLKDSPPNAAVAAKKNNNKSQITASNNTQSKIDPLDIPKPSGSSGGGGGGGGGQVEGGEANGEELDSDELPMVSPMLKQTPSILQAFIDNEDAKWFEEKAALKMRRQSSTDSRYSRVTSSNSFNLDISSFSEKRGNGANASSQSPPRRDEFYSMSGNFSMTHASSLAAMPSFKQDMEAFLIRFSDLDLEETPFAAGAGGKVYIYMCVCVCM
jgi:hypothetical protein